MRSASDDEEVRVKFIQDFMPGTGRLAYTEGAECVIDAASAAALILTGIAVTIPAIPLS